MDELHLQHDAGTNLRTSIGRLFMAQHTGHLTHYDFHIVFSDLNAAAPNSIAGGTRFQGTGSDIVTLNRKINFAQGLQSEGIDVSMDAVDEFSQTFVFNNDTTHTSDIAEAYDSYRYTGSGLGAHTLTLSVTRDRVLLFSVLRIDQSYTVMNASGSLTPNSFVVGPGPDGVLAQFLNNGRVLIISRTPKISNNLVTTISSGNTFTLPADYTNYNTLLIVYSPSGATQDNHVALPTGYIATLTSGTREIRLQGSQRMTYTASTRTFSTTSETFRWAQLT